MLKYKGSTYSYIGEDFESAICEKDINGNLIKGTENKLFLSERDNVIEVDLSSDEIDLRTRKATSREMKELMGSKEFISFIKKLKNGESE